jgi:hypothetical protein
MSKFLNADDTVDLIKSGVGALNEKVNYRQIDFPTLPSQNSMYIWITIPQNNYQVTFNCRIGYSIQGNFSIDWGDGSQVDTTTDITGLQSITHTYKYKGTCVVEIHTYNTTSNYLGGGTNTTQVLTPVTIVNKIANYGKMGKWLSNYAFYQAYNLQEMFLNNSSGILCYSKSVFEGCTMLTKIFSSITPPSINGSDTVNDTYRIFFGCSNLAEATIRIAHRVPAQLFNQCSALKKLVIYNYTSEAITNIDEYAFNQCSALEEIHFVNQTTPPTLASNAFNSTSSNLRIYVPKGTAAAYKAATGWSNYADKIVEEGAFDKLSTSGGSLTGDVTTTNTTFTNTSLVTKQYVDDTIAALDGNNLQY